MGYHSRLSSEAMPLIRPKLLIATAQIGARLYRREHDLAGAIPGLSTGARGIVGQLAEAEQHCEDLRRRRSPAYRPGKHVQILSALIAEARPVKKPNRRQKKASGSAALRSAM